MQCLAEAYTLLRFQGLSAREMHEVFARWNSEASDLQSYLLEISSKIVTFPDDRSDGDEEVHLLDKILDAAGSKGTGKWTVQSAADLGVASPCISAALEARFVSAQKDVRCRLERTFLSLPSQATSTSGGNASVGGGGSRERPRPLLPNATLADALLFAGDTLDSLDAGF